MRNQHVPRDIAPEQLAVLLRVSAALTASLQLQVVLQNAIEGATEVLGLETGAIYLLDQGTLRLSAATPPLPADFPEELRLARLADHPHIGRCIDDAIPLMVQDTEFETLTTAELAAAEARNLRSILYVPLSTSAGPLGTFIIGSTSHIGDFTEQDVSLCRTLSHQIALAIENAQLFESVAEKSMALEQAYDATLIGWSLALEMRDRETMGHTVRVAELAVELCRRIGIAEEDLDYVRWGALLHDIGKMAVPDEILHKPGSLTDDEWAIMRKHPEYARMFLAKIEHLTAALDIPYCHHERWDGAGYPQGLKGEEIPLAARAFSVIDVFDALTSDRPYRPAWTVDAALAHIRAQAGEQFDPLVVDAFLGMQPQLQPAFKDRA
jgi:putative nucleotidyltransferase with HDIG domain